MTAKRSARGSGELTSAEALAALRAKLQSATPTAACAACPLRARVHRQALAKALAVDIFANSTLHEEPEEWRTP